MRVIEIVYLSWLVITYLCLRLLMLMPLYDTTMLTRKLWLVTGWEELRDQSSGRTYYLNHATRMTSWDRPTAPASSSPPPPAYVQPLPSGTMFVSCTESLFGIVCAQRTEEWLPAGVISSFSEVLFLSDMICLFLAAQDVNLTSTNQSERCTC